MKGHKELRSIDIQEPTKTRLELLRERFASMPSGLIRNQVSHEIEVELGMWDVFTANRAKKAKEQLPIVRASVALQRKLDHVVPLEEVSAKIDIRIAGKKRQPGTGRYSQAQEYERARKKANRDRTEWDTMSAALMARNKLHKLPYPTAAGDRRKDTTSALDQKAGSIIGRMCMQGEATTAQFDAAQKYIEDVANYRMAIDAPAEPNAVDLLRGYGASVKLENVSFKVRAIDRYEGAAGADGVRRGGVLGALRDAAQQHRGANIIGALDHIVLRDTFYEHLIGDCRLGLNALAKHYGVMKITD